MLMLLNNGVVSKIATPVFTFCWQCCVMIHGIQVVFSSSRHCDFADDSVVQINMRFTSQTCLIGVAIKFISESYGCGKFMPRRSTSATCSLELDRVTDQPCSAKGPDYKTGLCKTPTI